MARTPITLTTLVGSYPALPLSANAANLNLQASTGASGSSGNQIAFSSTRLLVVVQNTAVGAQTVTITSNADNFNRTGDISAYSLSAGAVATFIFERAGWVQSDGNLYLESNSASVKFAAVAL